MIEKVTRKASTSTLKIDVFFGCKLNIYYINQYFTSFFQLSET